MKHKENPQQQIRTKVQGKLQLQKANVSNLVSIVEYISTVLKKKTKKTVKLRVNIAML